MSQPRLPNYIIVAAPNNTNGITLAVAHSAALYLLKTSDLCKHFTHLSALLSTETIEFKIFFRTAYVLGQYLKKQLSGLGLLQISLPPTLPEGGISTFPVGK